MSFKTVLNGSALIALPLFFLTLSAQAGVIELGKPRSSSGVDAGGLESSWTLLAINRDQINEGSTEAGFAGVGDSTMQLWGGGVVVQKGPTRWGALGMSGTLASNGPAGNSNWGLDIVGLVAEQRYPGNGWEVTAGFFTGYGQFSVDYRGAAYTRFDSRFVCSGATAGARWPTDGTMSFFIRSGYLWIPASGAWHGDLASKMAKTYYDLSAPFGQVGIDLMF